MLILSAIPDKYEKYIDVYKKMNGDKPTINLTVNPISGTSIIQITGELKPNAVLEVYEIGGKKVGELPFVNNTTSINNSSFVKGTYILVVKQDNIVFVDKKIVIL